MERESEEEESVNDDVISEKVEEGASVKEIGPPLLSSLQRDKTSDKLAAPWRIRLSSTIQPEIAVAGVSSNLWPGAHAYAFDKFVICLKYDMKSNLYVHKYI